MNRRPPWQREWVRRLHADHTNQEIQELTGIPLQTIKNWMSDEMRFKSDAHRSEQGRKAARRRWE